MKKKLVYIIAAIVIIAVFATAGAIYYNTANNYVATVAGEKVTKAEYRFFLSIAKRNMENEAGLDGEESKKSFWKGKEEAVKNDALDSAKEFKIQLIQAKEKKISLTKDDENNVNQTVDQTIQAYGGRAKADEQLKNMYGINLEEYKSIFKDFILINKFIEEERKTIETTDDEMNKYFEENKRDFGSATVKHILISTVDASRNPLPEHKQLEAKKKAEDVLQKAKEGQDFAELAKTYSEDPGSKDKGGEYTFTKGKMVKEFEEWSFDKNRKAGDMDIVKTSYGYHVMKFEKFEDTTFDKVKDQIKNSLQSKAYTKKLEDWKKDVKYNVIKNEAVFNSINIM
ncbi:MAG: peptidylprolyl isomerase [Clostridia bacterium]|nr:peptidylprolyl isomerase [Clostridia bacterium]